MVENCISKCLNGVYTCTPIPYLLGQLENSFQAQKFLFMMYMSGVCSYICSRVHVHAPVALDLELPSACSFLKMGQSSFLGYGLIGVITRYVPGGSARARLRRSVPGGTTLRSSSSAQTNVSERFRRFRLQQIPNLPSLEELAGTKNQCSIQ